MRFPATERTPDVDTLDQIAPGQRGTANGLHVYARCSQGHLVFLGRPRRVFGSLDDVPDARCPDCEKA